LAVEPAAKEPAAWVTANPSRQALDGRAQNRALGVQYRDGEIGIDGIDHRPSPGSPGERPACSGASACKGFPFAGSSGSRAPAIIASPRATAQVARSIHWLDDALPVRTSARNIFKRPWRVSKWSTLRWRVSSNCEGTGTGGPE